MSYNSLRTSKNINKTKFIRLMKTFRLLIVALLLAGSASAQRYERKAMRGEYSPTVYLISVQEVDTIYNYGPYAMQQAAVLNRMARLIGHLESIKHMIEDGRDCSEVLVQLSAVDSAIKGVSRIILKDHLEHCIVDAVRDNDQEALDQLNRAIDRFIK